jgi:hypothetical protein
VPRLIIYLVLLVAVTLPLLLGESLLPRAVDPSPAAQALYEQIESLDNNAPVLVAFDYDPTASGEMDVVAGEIVGHLADREARIVALSLLPAGPATAQSLLEKVAPQSNYVNLGYLPGQAAAVRLLSQSWDRAVGQDFEGTALADLSALDQVSTLEDFDLVIELAATQDSLRWWVEQADASSDISLGAGVSASVEPLARPYYETEEQQLVGLVAGVSGAAMYEPLRSGQDAPADALAVRLDAQLAASLVLISILLLGNIVYLGQRRTGEEQ